MKKLNVCVLLFLSLFFGFLPMQAMFVVRSSGAVVRQPSQQVRSCKYHDHIKHAQSIQELKDGFKEATKDKLSAMFYDVRERNEFIEEMEEDNKKMKQYYSKTRTYAIQCDDPLLPSLFCSAVRSTLSQFDCHPNSVAIISSEHLVKKWSPKSYRMRWQLRNSLKQLYPTESPDKLLQARVVGFQKDVLARPFGGIVIKNGEYAGAHIKPQLIFSHKLKPIMDQSGEKLPWGLQYMVECSIGWLIENISHTEYQLELKSQLPHDDKLEKLNDVLKPQYMRAAVACSILNPKSAKENYENFKIVDPESELCALHKKVYECHLYDGNFDSE